MLAAATLLLCVFGASSDGLAQPGALSGSGLIAGAASSASAEGVPTADRSVLQWVERMHAAPCQRSYTGTFVVLSASGAMSTSRIWHACDERNRLERVESLSGNPRTVFRRNDEVRTFSPESRTVRTDRRDTGTTFPRVAVVPGTAISQFYAATRLGQDRVAGYLADVVWFKPQDTLRFGYRLWSERDTGLVIKLQTITADGKVLENAAFSELDLRASLQPEQISRLMDTTAGFKEVSAPATRTSAQAEGWAMRQPVPGFVPVSCHQRSMAAADGAGQVLQCLYSDGLASVSLFLEPFDATRHPAQPQATSMGATHLLAQRLNADTWVTAVGEVPLQTLKVFTTQFQRIR
ncbi:MucB/RseB C-terminal domain-containing protein [Acidovorax sp. BL-A-41-H1]|uniref:MucB/RseB C-terminal domain-containing protein n=1 Tax=Acidovorax sp. BL-A-41-H1 TaxID=3421102 RepID=UPI003F7A29D3